MRGSYLPFAIDQLPSAISIQSPTDIRGAGAPFRRCAVSPFLQCAGAPFRRFAVSLSPRPPVSPSPRRLPIYPDREVRR